MVALLSQVAFALALETPTVSGVDRNLASREHRESGPGPGRAAASSLAADTCHRRLQGAPRHRPSEHDGRASQESEAAIALLREWDERRAEAPGDMAFLWLLPQIARTAAARFARCSRAADVVHPPPSRRTHASKA